MLQVKKMAHRGPMITGWGKKNGTLQIKTINYSTKNNATGTLNLIPVKENLIRVVFQEEPYPEERKSLAVVKNVKKAASLFIVSETDDFIEARTSLLKVKVSKKYCAIS